MRIDTAAERAFREMIWKRDKARDRATGQRLERHTDDWRVLGDVCHIKPKGAYPELRHATSNAILMSRANHILSDGRGGYLLKIEGNADETLTFRRYDRNGQLLWERESPCPR